VGGAHIQADGVQDAQDTYDEGQGSDGPQVATRRRPGLLPLRLRLQECPPLKLLERLPELLLRVHHDGAVPGDRLRFSASAGGAVSAQPTGSVGTARGPEALQNVPVSPNTYAPRRLDREGLPLARRHRHIEVDRVGGDPVHGARPPPDAPADDAHSLVKPQPRGALDLCQP